MNKKILLVSLVAVVVAISLVLPLSYGIIAERKCRKLLATANHSDLVAFKLKSYRRGWFSSKAELEVSLDNLGIVNPKTLPIIKAKIYHGPAYLDWVRVKLLQAAIDVTVMMDEYSFGKSEVAKARIEFTFDGKTQVFLSSSEFNYQFDRCRILWKGLEIEAELFDSCNDVCIRVTLNSLSLVGDKFSYEMEGFDSFERFIKYDDLIWLGEKKVGIERLAIRNKKNKPYFFEGVSFQLLTSIDHENLGDLTFNFDTTSAILGESEYRKNSLDLELTKFKLSSLNKIQQAIRLSNIFKSVTSAAFELGVAALDGRGKLEIHNFHSVTPWGELSLAMTISLLKRDELPGEWLEIVTDSTVDADIKAERPLVLKLLTKFYKISAKSPLSTIEDKVSKELDDWIKSGKILVVAESEMLNILLGYRNGEALINNKPLTVIFKHD